MNLLASRSQLRASFLRWALFLVPLVMLLGFASGMLSGSGAYNPWFAALDKPATYPAPILFPIVWTSLYFLMGLAAAMVASAWGAHGRAMALVLFALQLLINLAWSPVFFGMHQITAALGVIVALDLAVIVTIALFWRVRKVAGLLLLPYLVWILFATVLNWQFLQLNPDADGLEGSAPVQRMEL